MAQDKAIPRPLPKADVYTPTKVFWEAANEGRLLLQYCRDSGKYQWFPRPNSLYTGKRNVEWREVSGAGSLYSFTVTHSAWPGHEDRVPYICAYIELDEGVRILANVLNARAEDLRIGMRMKLVWERLSPEINYPAFTPA